MTLSSSGTQDRPRQGGALARRVGRLAALCVVPLLAVFVWAGFEIQRRDAAAAEQALVNAARVAAQRVDAEIEAQRMALEAFALGLSTEPEALAAADADARRLAEVLGAPVAVLDRALGMLVDTTQPFGTPLAATPAVATGLWVVETGRARVSDVVPAAGGAMAAPVLMVPVQRNGRTEAVLSVGLSRERLAAALGPGEGALLDGRGRIVAATQEDAAAALPSWPVLASLGQGMLHEVPREGGRPVPLAMSFLAGAPEWRVVSWAAPSPFILPVGRLPLVLVPGLVCIALAAVAARLTARRLGAPVLALTRHARGAAEALAGDGVPPKPPVLGGAVREMVELGTALGELERARQQRERRLRALAEAGALVVWRADPAGGWVEAAGWAGLTGQTAPAFRGDGWLEMLHPDDRAPTLAEWGRCLVARALIGVEFRLHVAADPAEWRWVRATGVPILDEDGQTQEWVGAIHEVTDARGAGAAFRFNESQVRQTVAELRAVYDTVPVGLALVDPSLRFVNVNARFAAISGLPPEAHVGRRAAEVMPEGMAAPLAAAQQAVLETGRPVLDVTCSGQAPAAVQHMRHWLASCHPVKGADGVVTGVSTVMQDVTDRVRAERSREMMVTELNHRVKNTLATVQSVATQSLRSSGVGGTVAVRDFVGRLQALTRSHDLLASHDWEAVDLIRVVQTALAPWMEAGRRVRINGSGRIQVTPGQAQALVLALHELATNAVKFGAFSRPDGEAAVTWSLGADAVVDFEWRESGGPEVTELAAGQRGFGMRMLERGLAHDLGPGATVRMVFAAEGIRATMRFRAGLPSLAPAEAG